MIDLVTVNYLEQRLEVISSNPNSVKFYTKNNLAEVESILGVAYSSILDGLVAPSKVVQSVTMRQARLYLLSIGILSQVDSLMSNEEDKISWEYATEVYRNSSIVDKIKVALELSDEHVDTMFNEASKL